MTSLVFDQSEVVRHVGRATFRCADRGIRVGRLGLFKPFEDPEFLETTGLVRFGLKRNTTGKVAIVEPDWAGFPPGRAP